MKEMTAKLKAIGDPHRIRILHLLSYGELSVSGLQQALGMSQSQVSRHLAYLRSAGLVTDQREGNQIFNKLTSPSNGTHRALAHFLECLFVEEETFWQDLRALREAIKGGVCQIRQAKLFPRTIAPKLSFVRPSQQLSSESQGGLS
jgi:ArsR family transcriptional regulator, arsenate/arsenite/antimonite-responsive transcriptional repressor